MPDDVELIELIEVDPGAFGDAPGGPPRPARRRDRRAETDGPVRARTRTDRLARLGMAACTVAVVALAASLLSLRPWAPSLRLSLDDPRPLTSDLSGRLVIAPPPAVLRAAALPDGTGESFAEWAADSVGYFFTEADATFDPDRSDASWFGFFAKRADDPRTPIVAGMTKIGDAPAEVSDETGGRIVDLYWGPVDGWMFRAVAAHSSIEEASAIAEQLRIVDGKVVVEDRRVLGVMVPSAPFGDYVTLSSLYRYADDFGQSVDGMAAVYYGFAGESVVSIPGRASALDMVPFLLSRDRRDGTVHGLPAVGFSKGAGPFGGIDRSTVIWWEDGRLVLVASDGDVAGTFELAERVRPATDEEWAEVQAVAATEDTGR